jgi:hypothetical protein
MLTRRPRKPTKVQEIRKVRKGRKFKTAIKRRRLRAANSKGSPTQKIHRCKEIIIEISTRGLKIYQEKSIKDRAFKTKVLSAKKTNALLAKG